MSDMNNWADKMERDLAHANERARDAEHKAQALQAELDALKAAHARLDAMPHDRTWTKDKPTPGKWWVSLAPEKRMGNEFLYAFGAGTFCASVYKTFDNDGTEILMARRENRHPSSRLTDAIFDGALWMRNEDPADPFAEQPRDNSRDSDLP